ncbi:DUF1214 domain-containing protein [Gordonia terrae]
MTFGTQRMTEDYARSVARVGYLWGWPLVNMHNRLSIMSQLPRPGLLGGVVPAAPPGSVGMLHDYIRPEERVVACPNQDVAYGFGVIDASQGPTVVQVPDFGDRFWVYQAVDQRTDSFVELGAMYGTAPGCYLLAPDDWEGDIPAGIAGVFRFDTRIAVCIPRVFMDDTDEDRAAIQGVLNRIMAYPLDQFTGEPKVTDWTDVPSFPTGNATEGEAETQWVDPSVFFDTLPEVLREVPPRPGEESMYQLLQGLLDAVAADSALGDAVRDEAERTQQSLLGELFEFRNIGIPVGHHWSTQRNGAAFGVDYLSRTAMGRANIFVNTPSETSYFYQDLDVHGDRLDGSSASYAVTFPDGGLPPVRGFWSLTLYNRHHFFHPNELDRYSVGTKNTTLRYNDDGSLTLIASNRRPTDQALEPNWLPAPDGPFSLYLRAYWPDAAIADGTWTPPAVERF